MKTIGILIGSEDEPISRRYYLKNKKKFECLNDLIDSFDYIPYDYALYAEAKAFEKKYNVNVIPLDGRNINLKSCNQCHSIFCLYEGGYNFLNDGLDAYNHYMNIIKKTKAKVYPSPKMQEFILYKKRYMQYLEKKGYNLIDTHYIPIKSYKQNKSRSIDKIDKFIKDNNYEKVIFKPEFSAFNRGVKKYKNPSKYLIQKYLDNIAGKTEYKNLLLQPFLEDFNKFWEVKTFWLLGKNIFSYGQKWNKYGEGYFTKPVSKGGKLNDSIVKECLKIGRKVIKDIFKDQEILIECRIDFGCCIPNSTKKFKYFINEIEISPVVGQTDSHKEYFHLFGEAIVKQCSI